MNTYERFFHRGLAFAYLHAEVGRKEGRSHTLYVVPNCQPPVYLVGPTRNAADMAASGAVPLMSVQAHNRGESQIETYVRLLRELGVEAEGIMLDKPLDVETAVDEMAEAMGELLADLEDKLDNTERAYQTERRIRERLDKRIEALDEQLADAMRLQAQWSRQCQTINEYQKLSAKLADEIESQKALAAREGKAATRYADMAGARINKIRELEAHLKVYKEDEALWRQEYVTQRDQAHRWERSYEEQVKLTGYERDARLEAEAKREIVLMPLDVEPLESDAP